MLTLSLLLGCEETTGPGEGAEGLSFSVSGMADGRIAVAGQPTTAVDLSSDRPDESFATASDDTVNHFVAIVAQRARGSGVIDYVRMRIVDPAAGDMRLCRDFVRRRCVSLALTLGGGTVNDPEVGAWYRLDSGGVTITSYGDGRIRGTFSGIASLYAGGDPDAAEMVTISNGRFDLPAPPFAGRLLLGCCGSAV